MSLRTFVFLLAAASSNFASAQQIQWCQVRLQDNAVMNCYPTRDGCLLFNKGNENFYTCMAIQK
jgi:hypothetical protein